MTDFPLSHGSPAKPQAFSRGAFSASVPRTALHHHLLMILCIIVSDLLALTLGFAGSVLLRFAYNGQFTLDVYIQLWPLVFLSVGVFALLKLYSNPMHPTEEIRRIFIGLTCLFLLMGTFRFFIRGAEIYSRLVFILAWFMSLSLTLIGRASTKTLLGQFKWWGYPTLVVGCGNVGKRLVRSLINQPELGLRPVGILDDRIHNHRRFRGVPFLGPTDKTFDVAKKNKHMRVVVVASDISRQRLSELFLHEQQHVRHMVIIPDMHGITSIGVQTHDMDGLIGLRVQHKLLDPTHVLFKRMGELFLVVLFSPLMVLITAIIAVAIKINSPGPIFYGDPRVGLGGKRFRAWKFRTMVVGAPQVLEKLLHDDPELAIEWRKNKKLKDDPRITRVGKFLRRTSLDELPQLWNVFIGQMSLVGPRPIFEDDQVRYGEGLSLYTRVCPGITGLWQVSGRNNLSYPDRVRMDLYYVRNWSIWMDIHILLRTPLVVLVARGAY